MDVQGEFTRALPALGSLQPHLPMTVGAPTESKAVLDQCDPYALSRGKEKQQTSDEPLHFSDSVVNIDSFSIPVTE